METDSSNRLGAHEEKDFFIRHKIINFTVKPPKSIVCSALQEEEESSRG